jgi:L-Ala-D/L-Glu epimerase
LAVNGCVMIEQPFLKSDIHKTQALRSYLNIPVIADEACQGISEIECVGQAFDGINIKLQKCGGITEALRMIRQARSSNLQVLIGCMSESSVGCNAAEFLSPMCDWADLDGPWLISNNTELMKSIGYN